MCSMSTIAKKRVTVFLDQSIIKHARAEAVIEDLTLTQLIEKAILQYLPKETVIKKSEHSFTLNEASNSARQ